MTHGIARATEGTEHLHGPFQRDAQGNAFFFGEGLPKRGVTVDRESMGRKIKEVDQVGIDHDVVGQIEDALLHQIPFLGVDRGIFLGVLHERRNTGLQFVIGVPATTGVMHFYAHGRNNIVVVHDEVLIGAGNLRVEQGVQHPRYGG